MGANLHEIIIVIIHLFIINKFIKAESVQNLYEIMQIIKKDNRNYS